MQRAKTPVAVAVLCRVELTQELTRCLTQIDFEPMDGREATAVACQVIIAELTEPDLSARAEELRRSPHPAALIAIGDWSGTTPVDGWLPRDAAANVISHVLASTLQRRLWSQKIEGLTQRLVEAHQAHAAAQREIEKLQPLAALGRATSSLHHDINNPLCTITLNAQLLMMTLHDSADEKVLLKLKTIEGCSDQIRDLTKAVAEVKHGKREPVASSSS